MPPPEVLNTELNQLMQDILSYASWGLTILILLAAWRLGKSERTPFYVLAVLAAGVGAFAEPLYDVAMDLYFYDAPGMYTHFTAFDIPQPIWTHSGYIVLYASAAIYAGKKIAAGTLTRRSIFGLAGIEFLMSCVFEMVGINGGAYEYWGPHQLRLFEYPLTIGVLEAAQVVLFTVAAFALRERVQTRTGLLGLFVLFPITFFGANFGAGWPLIISLHLDDPSAAVVTIGSLVSMGLAVALVRGASLFLPSNSGTAHDAVRSAEQTRDTIGAP